MDIYVILYYIGYILGSFVGIIIFILLIRSIYRLIFKSRKHKEKKMKSQKFITQLTRKRRLQRTKIITFIIELIILITIILFLFFYSNDFIDYIYNLLAVLIFTPPSLLLFSIPYLFQRSRYKRIQSRLESQEFIPELTIRFSSSKETWIHFKTTEKFCELTNIDGLRRRLPLDDLETFQVYKGDNAVILHDYTDRLKHTRMNYYSNNQNFNIELNNDPAAQQNLSAALIARLTFRNISVPSITFQGLLTEFWELESALNMIISNKKP